MRDGAEALEVVGRLWEGVEKRVRYPMSPETGAQAEFVRNFKRMEDVVVGPVGQGAGRRVTWEDPEDESD